MKRIMQTAVKRIEYDFDARVGRVYMEDGCCTDMAQCIDFFKAIDPDVIYIATIAGNEGDTSYRLIDWQWKAFVRAYTDA